MAAADLDTLREALREARDCLGSRKLRGTHYFLDQTLVRYLWGAIASAELALVAVEIKHASGTEAIKRHLHETVLDVTFIVSDPNPDLCAAKSILTDLDDWREVLAGHANVQAAFPDVPPVP